MNRITYEVGTYEPENISGVLGNALLLIPLTSIPLT